MYIFKSMRTSIINFSSYYIHLFITACRYEKGAWSECINGQMTREDKLKSTGGVSESSSCEPMRSINKKCNPNNGGASSKQANSGGGGSKKERKNKDKGT